MKTHARKEIQGKGDPLRTDEILTPAETRIACGYVDGMIGKEIADACGVSYNTVVRHTQNIYDKTGIKRSTNALVAWFLAKNYDLDLREFRHKLEALLMLVIVSVQTVCVDWNTNPVWRFPTRKVEVRRGAGRGRKRNENDYDLFTF